MTTNVYISIGNSDDKLTQRQWAQFVEDVDEAVAGLDGILVHGRWFSAPDADFQNACWCLEFLAKTDSFRAVLGGLAERYDQDSIAWATARTEFIAQRQKARA